MGGSDSNNVGRSSLSPTPRKGEKSDHENETKREGDHDRSFADLELVFNE